MSWTTTSISVTSQPPTDIGSWNPKSMLMTGIFTLTMLSRFATQFCTAAGSCERHWNADRDSPPAQSTKRNHKKRNKTKAHQKVCNVVASGGKEQKKASLCICIDKTCAQWGTWKCNLAELHQQTERSKIDWSHWWSKASNTPNTIHHDAVLWEVRLWVCSCTDPWTDGDSQNSTIQNSNSGLHQATADGLSGKMPVQPEIEKHGFFVWQCLDVWFLGHFGLHTQKSIFVNFPDFTFFAAKFSAICNIVALLHLRFALSVSCVLCQNVQNMGVLLQFWLHCPPTWVWHLVHKTAKFVQIFLHISMMQMSVIWSFKSFAKFGFSSKWLFVLWLFHRVFPPLHCKMQTETALCFLSKIQNCMDSIAIEMWRLMKRQKFQWKQKTLNFPQRNDLFVCCVSSKIKWHSEMKHFNHTNNALLHIEDCNKCWCHSETPCHHHHHHHHHHNNNNISNNNNNNNNNKRFFWGMKKGQSSDESGRESLFVVQVVVRIVVVIGRTRLHLVHLIK